ncbi:MAG: hypothetical protein NTY19_30945 [Planctomycetota bacterium]|nr:hypothetical protein [Planctomycetota bacterium]
MCCNRMLDAACAAVIWLLPVSSGSHAPRGNASLDAPRPIPRPIPRRRASKAGVPTQSVGTRPARRCPATLRHPVTLVLPIALALLIGIAATRHGIAAAPPAPAERLVIDEALAAAQGIRKLNGTHLTMYTDLPADPDVDELPAVFDLAVPQWCAYFQIAPARVRDWQLNGFLMQDKGRFQTEGLLPAQLPPFLNGYQSGPNLWLYNQPEAFYRRHLFLHEGTHAFMNLVLGGTGPPWYGEGLAELLGTHRWQDGTLTLGYLPRDKKETPGWGRIKIIKDEVAANRGLMPDKILDYDAKAHLRNEPYAWCWGLATFFDAHPRYQQRFRALQQSVRDRELTSRFREQLQADGKDLAEEWQLFVMNLEYGYEVARAAVVRKPAEPLPTAGAEVSIDAARGWQSTGIRLEGGVAYRLTTHGRYQVANTDEPWMCEPGGVTLHYYQGRPLGMLLGAVRDDAQPPPGLTPLARPEPIGLQRDWTPARSGTLYLKINESAAHLADNAGELTVRIQRGGA